VFGYCLAHVSAFKQVRRLEFTDELPKTISGKIRRVKLREREIELHADGDAGRAAGEFRLEDFPELR
jgi:acetyl-CoA synthetase